MFFRFFLFLLLFTPSVAGAEPLHLVTTIGPLADLLKKVGGEEVEVTALLRAGVDPHTFEPSPLEMRRIIAADLVVAVGFGFDGWIERMSRAGGGHTLKGSDAIARPLRYDHAGGHDDAEAANPHYWLDPAALKPVVTSVATALMTLRPAKGVLFKKRAEKLLTELDNLGAEVRARFEKLGEKRKFVAFHDSFSYFAQAFGLITVGLIQSAPGREPSAKEFARLMGMMRKEKVGVVVAEGGHGVLLATALAHETGAQVVMVDPLGGSGGPTGYFDLIRWNADQFVRGFRTGGEASSAPSAE